MIVRSALVCAGALAAGLAGAAVASSFSVSAPEIAAPRDPGPKLDGSAAAETIGAAQFAFRALRPAPAPVSGFEAVEAPPIEPDVAETFRAAVTAVLMEKGRRVVVILDPEAPKGRRTLRVGARYRDGWKVRAIDDSAVELRRGRDVRRIELFAPPPSADAAMDGATFAVSGDVSAPRQVLTRDRAMTTTQKE